MQSAEVISIRPAEDRQVANTLQDIQNVMDAQLASCSVFAVMMKDGSIVLGWEGNVKQHIHQAHYGASKLAQALLDL